MTSSDQKAAVPPVAPKVAPSKQPHEAAEKNQAIRVGYENGCPGLEEHLKLRFEGRPSTGIDGSPFELPISSLMTSWQKSDAPLTVVGLRDKRFTDPPPQDQATRDNLVLEASKAISVANAVTARWFVVHDTGGPGSYTSTSIPTKARGVHLFLNRASKDGTVLQHDFSEPGTATKFEKKAHHPEFQGLMVHVEMAATHATWNVDDNYTEFQLSSLAWAYIFASFRSKSYLTITGHREVDRGFPQGHNDPRGFDYDAFYERLCKILGLTGRSFGLMNLRGKVNNDSSAINTFPAQYGSIEKEKAVPKKKETKKETT